MRNGDGEMKWSNGDVYTGSFQQDKMNGEGTMVTHVMQFNPFLSVLMCMQNSQITKAGKYKGKYKDGHKDGLGTFIYNTGHRYEGQWKRNRFHGRGMYQWKDGKKYDGEWVDGMRTGTGITIMPNGEKHDGVKWRVR